MKILAITGLIIMASVSSATDSIQYLAANYSISIPTDTLISGSTGGFTGVYSDGSKFGTTTFTWERFNVDTATHTGYIVTTRVALPEAPNAAYFPNPATVTWLDPQEGGGGGAG